MSSQVAEKPRLSFWQMWNMSFGFLGIQYGFGLQQANLSPIFRYHGAEESELPILWLAGPVTGLLIQPIIGALSDGTWTRFGRRKPFYLIGALIGSLAVMFMPYVPALWMVVGLFWILDASMNTAMEPYRAMVGDKLNTEQRPFGFAIQSFMIAGGQIMAGLMPLAMLALGVSAESDGNSVPDIVKYSFVIGVVAMLSTVLWTAVTTKEDPPADMEAFLAEKATGSAVSRTISGLLDAVKEMPEQMRHLWWVKFFTWYGLPLMWQFLALSIARHVFNAPTPDSPGFAEGAANVGIAFTVMNVTTVVCSFFIPPFVRKIGNKEVYSALLLIGGVGYLSMQLFNDLNGVLACMVLVGIGWAGIITMPFIIATDSVPANRIGVYMGILNAYICIPQIISMLTIGLFYDSLLQGDPRNALALCGVCFLIGAGFATRLRNTVHPVTTGDVFEAEVEARSISER